MSQLTDERTTPTHSTSKPVLWLVTPCFNEESVLPQTIGEFVAKIEALIEQGVISNASRILYVDDGSTDATWDILYNAAQTHKVCAAISLGHNQGHQNALFAGLMQARSHCDCAITLDCDGQHDLCAIDSMLEAYRAGNHVVYGVRNDRGDDSTFKRVSASWYYKTLQRFGAETVYNHSDYRLLSAQALDALATFEERNLYLRGMVPLIGFEHTTIHYDQKSREAGTTHFTLRKMAHLALDGITSLTVRPIRIVSVLGILFGLIGLIGTIYAVITFITGHAVAGWASTVCLVLLLGGCQLLGIGIIGEYIGKIYLEVKRRPRFIIEKSAGIEEPTQDTLN